MTNTVRPRSGRAFDQLTLDAVRAGTVTADDFCISREQLEVQAAAAERANHRQLAENLRRAGEMTRLPNERVFEIYELLRPGRASHAELIGLARELARQDMPRTAAFIAEAAEAYRSRGIVRDG